MLSQIMSRKSVFTKNSSKKDNIMSFLIALLRCNLVVNRKYGKKSYFGLNMTFLLRTGVERNLDLHLENVCTTDEIRLPDIPLSESDPAMKELVSFTLENQ